MTTANHNDRAHAKLSASGSARWLNCPGSVEAETGYEDSGSVFAEEGTLAHEVADLCLKAGDDADSYIGVTVKCNGRDNIIEKVMAGHVQEYLDYVRAFQVANTDLFTEERVDFSNVVPNGFGTMDAAVIDYNTRICHIFDLKYGQGIAVDAFENSQGLLYAIGLLNEVGWLGAFDSFKIHIVQPRKANYSEWFVTVEQLNQFAAFVETRAQLALSPNAARIPGDKQCQWCKHKANCVELKEHTEHVIGNLFDDLSLEALKPQIPVLNDGDKRSILLSKKLIEDFLKAVEKDVFDTLNDGGTFPGFKLVEGRSNRKMIDGAEAQLCHEFADAVYNFKLKGLGELEKIAGKPRIAELTYKPQGRPTLVPDSDRRPALVEPQVALEFDDLDGEPL